MSVVIIGGNECMERQYKKICEKHKCKAKVFTLSLIHILLPGGKGINVSTVLMNLGIENKALGFVAGFVGDEIIRRLEERCV